MAEDPVKRIRQLKVGAPNVKLCFSSVPITNAFAVEKLIHKALSRESIGGEWFRGEPTDETIKLVEEMVASVGTIDEPPHSRKDPFEIIDQFHECGEAQQAERDARSHLVEVLDEFAGGGDAHDVVADGICMSVFGVTCSWLLDHLESSDWASPAITADVLRRVLLDEGVITSMVVAGFSVSQAAELIAATPASERFGPPAERLVTLRRFSRGNNQ